VRVGFSWPRIVWWEGFEVAQEVVIVLCPVHHPSQISELFMVLITPYEAIMIPTQNAVCSAEATQGAGILSVSGKNQGPDLADWNSVQVV